MDTPSRIIALCVLLVATSGLCVQYDRTDLWSYPSTDEIATDPAAYDNQEMFVFVVIEEVNATDGTIFVDSSPSRIDVSALDPMFVDTLSPGASVQVYGTLREQSQLLVAEEIVIDYHGSDERLYTYVTSLLGAILAAGGFLRYWRVDWRAFGFEPRGDR